MILDSVKENLIKDMVDFWLPRLGLDDWTIKVVASDSYAPGDKECEANIESDIKYHQANINVWKPFWESDERGRYKIIVHELTHLLICRLEPHISPSGDDLLEEVVQVIAMLFYRKHSDEIEE